MSTAWNWVHHIWMQIALVHVSFQKWCSFFFLSQTDSRLLTDKNTANFRYDQSVSNGAALQNIGAEFPTKKASFPLLHATLHLGVSSWNIHELLEAAQLDSLLDYSLSARLVFHQYRSTHDCAPKDDVADLFSIVIYIWKFSSQILTDSKFLF